MIAAAAIAACFGLTFLEKRETNTFETDLVHNQNIQVEVPEEISRANFLANQRRLVEKRIELSRRIAREVIARRMTLGDAADQLQSLDHQSAPLCREFYEFIFPEIYPGRSETERYCRRALALVNSELAGDPAKRGMVIRCLDQEYQLKFSNGAVQAPY
jgi:hypothetical protein